MGEPERISLDAVGIRRKLGADVANDVPDLCQGVRMGPQVSVVVPHVVKSPARRGNQAQDIGPVTIKVGVAQQKGVCRAGSALQRIRMSQPFCLRSKPDVLPGLRVGRLDLGQPMAQELSFLGSLSRSGSQIRKRRVDLTHPRVALAIDT